MNLLRRIFPYLALLAILLAAHWHATQSHFRGPLPPLQGLSLEGRSITLEQPKRSSRSQQSSRSQGPTLIYFWATWCGVCRAVHGNVADLAEDYSVVAIAMRSGPPSKVVAFVEQHPFGKNVHHLVDPEGQLAQLLGVRGIPTFFFVNRKGEVISSTVGYTTEMGLRIRLLWAGLD